MGVVFDAGTPEKAEQGGPIFAAAKTPTGFRLRFGDPGPDLDQVHVGDFVWISSDPRVTSAGLRASEAGRGALGRIPVDLVVTGAAGQPLTVHASAGRVRESAARESAARESAARESAARESAARESAARPPARPFTAAATSTSILAPARGAGITRELITDKLGSFGGTPFHLGELDVSGLAPAMHLPVSELKELRRALVAELDTQLDRVDRVVAAESVIEAVRAEAFARISGSVPAASDSAARDTAARDTAARDTAASVTAASVTAASVPAASDSAGGDTAASDTAASDTAASDTAASVTAASVTAASVTAASDTAASDSAASVTAASDAVVVPLCRNDAQLDAVLDAGAREVELDWMELVGLQRAVTRARARGAKVGVVTVRVQKPGEDKIDSHFARLEPDSVLVRSWGSLAYFAGPGAPILHGDFSLNITNSLTAAWVLQHGVATLTAAHDLDRDQLFALLAAAPRGRIAVTVHHHIPTFHTEHCVYAHLLSHGRDYKTCGRPCERHQIALRDRVGLVHPVNVDVGCRNTVFNAQAQSAAALVPDLLAAGVRRLRIELVRESAAETARVYDAYVRLAAGQISASDAVRTTAVHEQFGVTRGTMRTLTVLR
jgi:putative protease